AGSPKDASGNPLGGRVVSCASGAPAVEIETLSLHDALPISGTATITATSEGQSGTSAISVTAVSTNPGTVTDLSVAGVTTSGVRSEERRVGKEGGQPAGEEIRWDVSANSGAAAAELTRGTFA